MAPEYSRVCFTDNTGNVPSSKKQPIDSSESLTHAISVNPRNGSLSKSFPISNLDVDEPKRLALKTTKLWNTGRELKVHFRAGSAWQHERVKKHAPVWSQYANIKFNFDVSGKPDILIDFDSTDGSWSNLGTDSSIVIADGRASMNLGWIVDTKTDADHRQVILHEFGHALGAVHEHESPFANIQWNKKVVYEDLGGDPNFWDPDTVDKNMFTLYKQAEVPSTAFDGESIMLYSYPASWTLDGKGTSYNTVLSEQDKSFIAFCYPKDQFDAAQLNSLVKYPQGLSSTTMESVMYFYKKHSSAPSLVYGLNWIDVAKGANIRVRATVQNIQQDHFTASLETWSNTKLNAAGMTWLEVPRFPFLQTGAFSIEDVHPWDKPQPKTNKRINFQSPFSSPPKIACFFTSLDIKDGENWRAKVYPSNIDSNGFTINIDTWDSTTLYAAKATWLAYPSDQTKVASGRFYDANIPNPQEEFSGKVDLGTRFTKTPKVFMALDELDYKCDRDLKWRVSLSNVTSSIIAWSLQGWGDSVMYASGASFFAWEDAA